MKNTILSLAITLLTIGHISTQVALEDIIALSQNGDFSQAHQLFVERETALGIQEGTQVAKAYNYSWWGKYQESVDIFNKVIKNNPNNIEALIGIAYTYRYMGHHAKAVQHFTLALNEDPHLLSAHKGLLFSYLESDQISGAKHHLELAQKIAPYDEELYYAAGLINLKNQDFKGARNAFENSIDLNNNYSPSLFQLSRMVKNPSKWEVTPWIGLSKINQSSTVGIRRLDVFYNSSTNNLIYGFWDNSLRFENSFLMNNQLNSGMIGIGDSYTWNDHHSTNIRGGYRTVEGEPALWSGRVEHNIIFKKRLRIQGGLQYDFDSEVKFQLLSLAAELRITDFFSLEANSFFTHIYINNQNENRFAIVPKFLLGKNIEFLTGIIFDQSSNLELDMKGWKGSYSIVSFPITDYLFSRVLYVYQKEMTGDVQSLSLGLSLKL